MEYWNRNRKLEFDFLKSSKFHTRTSFENALVSRYRIPVYVGVGRHCESALSSETCQRIEFIVTK